MRKKNKSAALWAILGLGLGIVFLKAKPGSIGEFVQDAIAGLQDLERKDGPLSDTTVDQVLKRGRP